MNSFEGQRYSDEECVDAFRELFPQGFAAEDVIAEIAPEGWDRSPLVAIFHPSLEQVFQEAVVYEMIFKRLRGRHFDWVYHFPRLNLIDLQPLRESLKPDNEPDWADYSPESALAREREDQDRQQRLAEMKRKMDEDHARALEDARSGPPPWTVLAYQRAYGRFPRGWPP